MSDHSRFTAPILNRANELWTRNKDTLLTPTLAFLSAWIFFLVHRHEALLDSGLLYPWDVTWYRSIVENGYTFDGNIFKNQNVAFMPLYPLLTYIFKTILGISDTSMAMILTSAALTYIFSLYLYRLTAQISTPHAALAALLCLLFFPYSFYLFNGYAESCFLACAVLFLYFFTHQRYWCAAITASISFLAKQIGVILIGTYILTLVVYIFRNHKTSPAIAAKYRHLLLETFPVLFFGMVGWTLYLYVRFSDPMLFKNVLISWTLTVTPGTIDPAGLLNSLRNMIFSLWVALRSRNDPVAMAYILAMGSFVTIVLCAGVGKMRNPALLIYALLFLLFNIVLRPHAINADLGRYLVMNLTFFVSLPLLIGWIFPKSSRWYWLTLGLILSFFSAYYGHYVFLFYHGKWVS